MKASEISKYYGDQESTAHRQKRSKATKTKAGEVAHRQTMMKEHKLQNTDEEG